MSLRREAIAIHPPTRIAVTGASLSADVDLLLGATVSLRLSSGRPFVTILQGSTLASGS